MLQTGLPSFLWARRGVLAQPRAWALVGQHREQESTSLLYQGLPLRVAWPALLRSPLWATALGFSPLGAVVAPSSSPCPLPRTLSAQLHPCSLLSLQPSGRPLSAPRPPAAVHRGAPGPSG